jgi:hypothetical protein
MSNLKNKEYQQSFSTGLEGINQTKKSWAACDGPAHVLQK